MMRVIIWLTVAILSPRISAGRNHEYQKAEREISQYVNSMLKNLLPYVMGRSDSANVSLHCTASMMKIFGNVRKLRGWTLKLLDSTGKPTTGILAGTSHSLGNYDQCLELLVNNRGQETANHTEAMFQGKYCKVRIRFTHAIIETARDYHRGLVNASDLGKIREIIEMIPYLPFASDYMHHFLGLCVPSTCTTDDIQQMLGAVTFPGSAVVEQCEIKTETQIQRHQIIIIILFGFLICPTVVSTALNCVFPSSQKTTDNRCVNITIAFSFCNNTRKWLENTEHLKCGVSGLVAFSLAWILFGTTYLVPLDTFYAQSRSLINLKQYLSEAYFAFVVSFPLAIETLFLCYGFLCMWQAETKKSANPFKIIIHRYIRLCFPLLITLGILFLLPIFGSGPFWSDINDKVIETCQKNFLSQIFMYSNFLDVKDQCLPHLWFVPSLMQITIVAAFICWVASKNWKLGIGIILSVTVACNVAVIVLTCRYNLPPAYVVYFMERDSTTFWQVNLALPLTHFGSFGIGMILGMMISRKVVPPLRPALSIMGWILSLSLMCCPILLLHFYRDNSMGPYWSAIYAANHRTVFGLGVAWVLLVCANQNGGFVRSLLTWNAFQPLSRLSYFAYVLHLVVIFTVVGSAREHTYYSHVELLLRGTSYLCVSYVFSYFLYVMIGMPLQSTCSFSKHQTLCLNDVYKARQNCMLWSVKENKHENLNQTLP